MRLTRRVDSVSRPGRIGGNSGHPALACRQCALYFFSQLFWLLCSPMLCATCRVIVICPKLLRQAVGGGKAPCLSLNAGAGDQARLRRGYRRHMPFSATTMTRLPSHTFIRAFSVRHAPPRIPKKGDKGIADRLNGSALSVSFAHSRRRYVRRS